MAVNLFDQPESSRIEGREDGRLVGFAAYRLDGATLVLTHTEVDPAVRGQGIAARLARAALDQARDRGQRVLPLCSYMAAYVDKHPEYADLISPSP